MSKISISIWISFIYRRSCPGDERDKWGAAGACSVDWPAQWMYVAGAGMDSARYSVHC